MRSRLMDHPLKGQFDARYTEKGLRDLVMHHATLESVKFIKAAIEA
jgi:hypothetical protein